MDVERITLALQQQRGSRPSPIPDRTSMDPGNGTSSGLAGGSLLLPGASMTDSMLSSATTSDHDGPTFGYQIPAANSASSTSSSLPPSQSHSSSHSRSASQPENLTFPPPMTINESTSALQLDTSVLTNASSNDWVAEFQAHLAREQEQGGPHVRSRMSETGGNGSPGESESASLLLSESQTSMSLPETSEYESESVSGRESTTSALAEAAPDASPLNSSIFPHTTMVEASTVIVNPPRLGEEASTNQQPMPSWLASKTKSELWKEMKILAFTRALTLIYSISLLSIFTHIQLNLLGTRKYIHSVRQLARQSQSPSSDASFSPFGSYVAASSLAALFFGSTADLVGDDWETSEDADHASEWEVTEETERKFLTMGWWLLNVGWKDVGERVRSAMDDVLSGVSLKSELGIAEFEELIQDVRKRVEYEGPESDRTVNFLGTLIPGGELDQEFVLLQGGIPSSSAHIDAKTSPGLRSLIASACAYVSSADFGVVLGACVDRASRVLVRGVGEEVFDVGGDGSTSGWRGRGIVELQEGDEDEEDRPRKVRLAAMLPAVTRWSHLAVSGIPNEVLESMSDLREMTAFSAIMYSASIDELVA
ncbi:hypothetical protein DL93DRAFT_2084612 [Clavulina sp. PMI_390]|nr:hypothetical protein DL93DRAFT_2084612 [Clavulina sp. PMI_390]